MIALDATLRRLTVCQLTRESRGNGGGLRPRVWLRLRAAAGGNWTPDAYNWKAKPMEHEAHPKTTLCGVVFQKIEWAPASRARFKDRNCRNWEATLPVRSHGHVPSGAGGCGYRPRPRGGVAMTDIATHNDPIATIGMDLGKRNLIGMDARGKVIMRQQLSRGRLERHMAKYRGRGPITNNQVAALLRDYDIRPVVVHPTQRADFSRHGYRATQFDDAFARFLPHEPNIRTLKREGMCSDVRMITTGWAAR